MSIINTLFNRSITTAEQVVRAADDLVLESGVLKDFVRMQATRKPHEAPVGAIKQGLEKGMRIGTLQYIERRLSKISDSPIVSSASRTDAHNGAQAIRRVIEGHDPLDVAKAERLHDNVSILAAQLLIDLGDSRPQGLLDLFM